MREKNERTIRDDIASLSILGFRIGGRIGRSHELKRKNNEFVTKLVFLYKNGLLLNCRGKTGFLSPKQVILYKNQFVARANNMFFTFFPFVRKSCHMGIDFLRKYAIVGM